MTDLTKLSTFDAIADALMEKDGVHDVEFDIVTRGKKVIPPEGGDYRDTAWFCRILISYDPEKGVPLQPEFRRQSAIVVKPGRLEISCTMLDEEWPNLIIRAMLEGKVK